MAGGQVQHWHPPQFGPSLRRSSPPFYPTRQPHPTPSKPTTHLLGGQDVRGGGLVLLDDKLNRRHGEEERHDHACGPGGGGRLGWLGQEGAAGAASTARKALSACWNARSTSKLCKWRSQRRSQGADSWVA